MKILVVDDEVSLCEFLGEAIRIQGHEVKTARDGCEGLEVFKSEPFDLIMTDIQMPRMNGLDFLSNIRELNREVIVIIFTGLGSEDVALEALRRNANDFLRKPIHQQILFPLLAKYSGIVAAKSLMAETLDLYVSRSFVLEFPNRLEMVPQIVKRIMQEAGDAIPADQHLGLRIGMSELIVNAIEHGNLGITYEEKLASMERGADCLDDLVNSRLSRPEISRRRVQVEGRMTREYCQWRISDEGAGFDWRTLPKPLSPENLENPNGRGIFLARLQFDALEFLGSGNQVRITKKRPAQPPAKAAVF